MTACAMGFKVNLALPRVTRVDLFHPIGASVDCGLLARSEKRRDVFDLIVGDLRKRRHTGTSGVDDRPDLFAVFIAQSDGGANKVGAFPARRIGAMTEAAGGNEQVFSALHCRRIGNGTADEECIPARRGRLRAQTESKYHRQDDSQYEHLPLQRLSQRTRYAEHRMKPPVRIGMLGSGFVADFYMQGLANVRGQEVATGGLYNGSAQVCDLRSMPCADGSDFREDGNGPVDYAMRPEGISRRRPSMRRGDTI